MHHDVARNRADHPVRLPLVRQRAGEVHQPAALGVHGQAGVDRGADPRAQRRVRLEFRGEELGKAAADEQPVDVGQLRVAAGRRRRPASRRRRAARRGRRHSRSRTRGPARRRCAGRGAAAGGYGSATASPGTASGGTSAATRNSSSRSTCAADDGADRGDALLGAVGFVAGREPQVALGDLEPRVAVHGAQHAHVRVVLDHHPQLGLVPAAAQVVQDHAGDLHVAVERLVAEDQRRDAARHPARVDDQDDGQAERLRQRRVAVAAVEREAVVEPLVALDYADVGLGGVPPERAAIFGHVRQVGVEIAAAPAASPSSATSGRCSPAPS